MGKVISTLVTVFVAVAASGVIWVGANLLFGQVRSNWRRFSALAFGIAGFAIGVLISGNRISRGSDGDHLGFLPWDWLTSFVLWIWLPLAIGAAFAGTAVALSNTSDPAQRRTFTLGAAAVVGIGIGVLIRPEYQPGLDIVPLIVWTAVGIVAGGAHALARRRPPQSAIVVGAAAGWLVGAWGAADLGEGSMLTALVATVVPALLIGYRLGSTTNPELEARTTIDKKSRATIFLAPALLFIFVMLVVPAIRTAYLSLLDRRSENWVGLGNYRATFTDPTSWNAANWTDMFGSRLFFIGGVLLICALVAGIASKRQTGRAVELGGPAALPLIVGGLLVGFAAFTALRGTIVNNLWWVITVTFFSTALGLAIAVLADNAKFERLAKSIIFMPMAISLVGAAIIWRFMYVSRDISLEQTGVMNAAWVGLGRLSTGSGIPTFLFGALIALALVGLLVLIARSLVRRQYAQLTMPVLATFLVGWFFWRYVGSSGVGGVTTNAAGEFQARPVQFIQELPYNNFWLMVILIWIQTGFAMVILSAAIKAVPEEFIEAARVDGATPSQIFWRITLPQIATTIGVVVTTLIVTVMKVYDIVRVMTNGNFETQVLANEMYNRALAGGGDIGRGAALAMLILVSVLPVIVLNIRRMQKEG